MFVVGHQMGSSKEKLVKLANVGIAAYQYVHSESSYCPRMRMHWLYTLPAAIQPIILA